MHVIPLQDGARRYRLEISHGQEYLEGFDVFVVDVTPEYAHHLLERMNLFASAHAKDEALLEMYFWDGNGDFFAIDYDREDRSNPMPPVSEPSRTECNQVIVRAEEVAWFAYPKHGDETLNTEAIPKKDLLEIAGTPLVCRCR
jgi:hypothetical protein